jgi:CBS domain-containing protein
MQVRDIMTPQVTCVRSVAFLPEAAQTMLNEDVGMLPVVDGGKLIGVITDRDIAVRAVAAGKDVTKTKVSDCLTAGTLITVSPDTDVKQAEELMETNQIRRIPVIGDDGKLVGVVGVGDIIRKVGDQEAVEVMERVTKPGGPHAQGQT